MAGDLFTLTSEELVIANKIIAMLGKITAEKNLTQSLTEFSTRQLTKYERKKVLREIKNTLKILTLQNNEECLIAYIKTLPLRTIVALAHNLEEFEHFCCSSEKLQSHWEQLITAQGAPTTPSFRWRVLHNATPPFDQLRAIVFFVKSLEESDQTLKRSYNDEAARFGCFYAQYVEIVLLLAEYYNNITNDSLKNIIIAKACRAAELHGMPGCVLLTMVFMSIALTYKYSFLETHNLLHKYAAKLYCDYAATCLALAKNLERAKESEDPLYNAGVGSPFFENFRRLCRHPEEYTDLSSMEETLKNKISDKEVLPLQSPPLALDHLLSAEVSRPRLA